MSDNREKLNAAIGKLLDRINASLDKKEAPNPRELEALEKLVGLTSLNYQIDGPKKAVCATARLAQEVAKEITEKCKLSMENLFVIASKEMLD